MKFRSKSEDSRNFIKLKPNESMDGVFRGELFEFRTHWQDRRSVVCEGSEKCALCKNGDKSKFRFRVNFVVREGDQYVAKVIEQGWNFYEVLRDLNDGDYPLEKNVMKITRRGEGLNTSYSVLPKSGGVVTAELEKKLSDVKLNDLGHITEKEVEPAEPPPIEDDDLGDIPF